jgi:ABC-type branched-subunit amino acid transport system permease subunit
MDPVALFQGAARSAFGPDAAAYALLAIGLNMHFGHAGLANFGQVGFMMLAAYGIGVSVATWGWSLWLGIAVGLGLCVVFALMLGLPTLKLRADYFAITTIAAAEIFRLLIGATSSVDVTGGPYGLQDISPRFLRLNPWLWDDSRTGFGAFLQNLAGPWAFRTSMVLGAIALLGGAVLLLARWRDRRGPTEPPVSGQPAVPATEAEHEDTLVRARDAKDAEAVASGGPRAVPGGGNNPGHHETLPRWLTVTLVVLVGLTGYVAVVLGLGHFTVYEEHFAQFRFIHTQYWTMAVAWTLVLASVIFIARLMSSPWGRVIRSIREDEDVAASVGKNVFGYKLQALVIGGLIGGLAGVTTTLGNSTVNDVAFVPLVTFFAYACLIIGGVGSRVGPVLGAMLFWFVFRAAQTTLSQFQREGWLPDWLGGAGARGALASALMGLLLVAVTAFRPQGILGKREDMVFGG